ncbi:hypothetical protein PSN45_000303 [Yamadazyma tenuis]|uniref:uncharacterized protein n=1 Tax=Candida tenuis TaxID=2315449 RepID=UPI0027A6D03A|nr:hypothetical protein PSN45_000303 [Yamadazyma tenuis]
MTSQASFSATTTHFTHLRDVVSAASSIDPHGLVIVSDQGLVFFSESNHILNFQAVVDVSLFSSYQVVLPPGNSSTPTDIRFGLDLSLVAHALDVLVQTDIICYLSYNGEGSPFVLEFEDNIISETIEFLTMYVDISCPYDSEDAEHELLANYSDWKYELILQSAIFSNLLQDLQQINTRQVHIVVNSTPKKELSFISDGPLGLSKIIYPSESSVLEKLEISTAAKAISTFKFSNFFKIMKAVKISAKSKIICDNNDISSVQLLCRSGGNYSATVITINMLELDEQVDIDDLERCFAEKETTKRRRLNDPVNNIVEDVPLFL